jgi:hypothetical protein
MINRSKSVVDLSTDKRAIFFWKRFGLPVLKKYRVHVVTKYDEGAVTLTVRPPP